MSRYSLPDKRFMEIVHGFIIYLCTIPQKLRPLSDLVLNHFTVTGGRGYRVNRYRGQPSSEVNGDIIGPVTQPHSAQNLQVNSGAYMTLPTWQTAGSDEERKKKTGDRTSNSRLMSTVSPEVIYCHLALITGLKDNSWLQFWNSLQLTNSREISGILELPIE